MPEMADPSPTPKTPWRVICLVALVPALDAVFRLGRIHPDEVFQFLEPAMTRAFGFGVTAWEWQVGLRNWFVPGVFSYVLRALSAVGVNDVQLRRAALEVPQYALHVGMLGAVFRLAARRVTFDAARLATLLVGLYPVLIWFGGRTMGESFSAAALVWGLERLDANEKGAGPFIGGLLLGFAEITRYGSAAVIVPAMFWLLITRRWRTFALSAAAGGLVALALGFLDLQTWGSWFHSLRKYLDFNVISGQAEQQFGAAPWHAETIKLPWYITGFIVAPWALAGFIWWGGHRASRVWLFVVPSLVYVAAISATPHKELRFIYPALVLLTVAAAPACAEWVLSLRTAALWQRAGAVTLFGATLALFFVPTPLDVQRPEQFQLTVKASRGATGFILMNDGLWGSGGFFYLGQNLPWCPCDTPQDGCFQSGSRDPRFNRAIYYNDLLNPTRNAQSVAAFVSAGFHVVEHRGEATYLER